MNQDKPQHTVYVYRNPFVLRNLFFAGCTERHNVQTYTFCSVVVLILREKPSHARWKKEFGWQRKLTPHLIVLPRIDKGATASKHATRLVQVILTAVVEGIVTLTDSVSGLVVCCTGMYWRARLGCDHALYKFTITTITTCLCSSCQSQVRPSVAVPISHVLSAVQQQHNTQKRSQC